MKKKIITEITSLAQLLTAIAEGTYRVTHSPQTKITKTEREKQFGSIGRRSFPKKIYSGMTSIANTANALVSRIKLMEQNAKTAILHDYMAAREELTQLRMEYEKTQQLFNDTVEMLFPATKGKQWGIRTGWKIVVPDVKVGIVGPSLAFPMSLASFFSAHGPPPPPHSSSSSEEMIVVE